MGMGDNPTQDVIIEQVSKATEKFEEKLDCELEATGHEMSDQDMFSREYYARGLMSEALSQAGLSVGGWLDYDKRSGDIMIRFSILFQGEPLRDSKFITATYDGEAWSELNF